MPRAGVGSAERVGKWYQFGIRAPAEALAPQIAPQIYVCAGDLFVSSRSVLSGSSEKPGLGFLAGVTGLARAFVLQTLRYRIGI